MTARRIQQERVFALLLATTALAVPVSGALLYGGTAPDRAFLFIGAVSQSDFVPVLLLVGALGLLVMSGRGAGERPPLAVLTAGILLSAGATLSLAYVGSAYYLRPDGPFGLDEQGSRIGWSTSRLATVGSLAMTGVLCAVVAVQAAMWIGERNTRIVR